MDWVTTTTILERMKKADDQSVWGRFHDRFRRPLMGFARRYGLAEPEAEDVVQEVLAIFVESYRGGRYDREKGRLSSWLFGIAFQQIANRRRRLAREMGRAADGTVSSLPDDESAQRTWDSEWEQGILHECMTQARAEVSERTFEAFRLIVREGKTADEAAAELGMSRAAVYVAKHRMLKRLADLMRDYEHFQA